MSGKKYSYLTGDINVSPGGKPGGGAATMVPIIVVGAGGARVTGAVLAGPVEPDILPVLAPH
jgi:hypothetical protein